MRNLFVKVINVLSTQVPLDVDLAVSYANGSDDERKFVSNLAQLLVTFLKEHSKLVEILKLDCNDEESLQLKNAHMVSLKYLLKISHIEDVEVFKICLDYWNWLCLELFRESPFETNEHPLLESLKRLRENFNQTPRRQLYTDVLSDLRSLMISRMAKPEEVIVVINDNNEAVRELVKDTDSVILYKTMRETLGIYKKKIKLCLLKNKKFSSFNTFGLSRYRIEND